MGLIGYKGVLYGGGSDVEANPSGSATDTIEKIGIDGDIYEISDADAVHTSDIGTANGVAELDANGLVPSSQLPSYVDDVLEYASQSAFPATGETGKIYVALDTNLTYRWSGSAYVEISPSLALGETSSTAYRGDRGKTAYDHATESGKVSQAVSSGLYKVGVTAQGHIASTTPVAKGDLTALGVADQNDVDAIEEDIQGYKTVTGEYITVSDGAALPAKSFSLTLTPFQEGSGDPSPSNIRPIHGTDEVGVNVRGKNLLDANDFTVAANVDTSVTIKEFALSAGTHTFSFTLGSSITAERSRPYIRINDTTNNYALVDYKTQGRGSWTFTLESDSTISLRWWMVSNNVAVTISDLMLETGSTPTTFEPYSLTTTPLSLPTTVYGGTVDVTGGSGQVTMAEADLGSIVWNYSTTNQVFYGDIPIKVHAIGEMSRLLTTCYATATIGYPANMADNTVMQSFEIGRIYIKDTAYTDAQVFKTAVTGQKIVYELATPSSLSTTPTSISLLNGVNNVWAECSENNVVVGNASQSLTYQPQNIVGELREQINAIKGGTFTRISVQNIVGTAWAITPNNIASLTITAPKEDLGLNNDDFYILEGVELVDWQDSSKKYPYVITKFVDDRENNSITINGFMIHNESSIRGVKHTFNFIVVS